VNSNIAGGTIEAMQIYWSLKSVPELSGLPEKRRQEVWRECGYQTTRVYRWSLVVGLILIASLFFGIVLPFQSGSFLLVLGKSFLWTELFFFACALALERLSLHLRIVTSLPEIRKRVGGLCIECGYDIRATPHQCPECGRIVRDDKTDSTEVDGQPPRILVVPSSRPFLRTHRTRFP